MEYLKTEYGSDSDEDGDPHPKDLQCELKHSKEFEAHKPNKSSLNSKVCPMINSLESDTEKRPTKNEGFNFLGIPQSSHLPQEESVNADAKLSSGESPYQTVLLDDSLVHVEIPTTSFWKESTSNLDIQEVQQPKSVSEPSVKSKSSYIKQESYYPSNQQKRSSRSDKNYNQYTRRKHHNQAQGESSISSTSGRCKTVTSEKHSQRKIYFVHSKIQPLLHTQSHQCKPPQTTVLTESVHSGVVNRVLWCIPNFSHLFVSCSMDASLKVWNAWSQLDPCVQVLSSHTKAVKDVIWSRDGHQLLSASYDRSAAITDVEKGTVVSQLAHSSFVSCIRSHPVSHHLCITGENNKILAWDTRITETPCRTFSYKDKLGQVQDLLFDNDGSTFFSCSDLVSRDSSDRNLMAWDFRSGVTLSNQIYQERYTLTRLKGCGDHQMLAQSQGNYIAIFSKSRPYKMCRNKRFDRHKVQGYSIGFDLSADERLVYSGSSEGKIYCYNYQTGRLYNTLNTGLDVVMDVACHPVLPSTVLACSWNGQIQLWS